MLTEKEKMQRARYYLLKLREGIDPITDRKINDDSVLQNQRLKRCFSYLIDVLGRDLQTVDAQERRSQKRSRKQAFYITEEELGRIRLPESDCTVSEFVKAVNDAVNDDTRKKLGTRAVNGWLVEKGYLKNDTSESNRSHKELTAKSTEIGIYSKQGMGVHGPYTVVLHSRQSQEFLLAHLQEIIRWYEEEQNDDLSSDGDH